MYECKPLDTGSNLVGGLDGLTHSVNVSSTTSQAVPSGDGYELEARLSGATLTGTKIIQTVNGVAQFRDLTLVSQEPSGERIPGQDSTLTFGSPSRGVSGTDKLYRLQFAANLPGLATTVRAFSISMLEAGAYTRPLFSST